jgi:hypothetical protein
MVKPSGDIARHQRLKDNDEENAAPRKMWNFAMTTRS